MTWTKLGDEFAGDTVELSDAAFRTHVEALMWSNYRLLDLAIPKRDVKRFAETDDPDQAVKELVDAGWWEDHGDRWWVGCRFPEWQRDRVQVQHRRAQWSEQKRRQRRHRLGDHSLCLPTAQCVLIAGLSVVDSVPDPVSVSVSGRDSSYREQQSNVDDDDDDDDPWSSSDGGDAA